MKFVPCTPETKPRIIELIRSYTHVYGVDIRECGSQDLHIAFIENYGSGSDKVIFGEFVDDDGEVISVTGFYFAETAPACIVRTGFHTKVGLTRYKHPDLFKQILLAIWPEIEKRNVTEFYWVQRAARARQVENFYNYDQDPAIRKIFDGWILRDFERLEPFSYATNELLGMYLLGPMNGIIPKPMVIKQLFKKSAYVK